MPNPLHHHEQPDPQGPGDDDRRAVEMLYRAFSDGDPDLLDQVVAEDWQDIPLAPHQQPGRAGMKPLILAFSAAFSDLRITILDLVGGRLTHTWHLEDWFGWLGQVGAWPVVSPEVGS